MQFYDILRAATTNALLLTLLFTLARPKYGKWVLHSALLTIVLLDLALNVYFYLKGDYTTIGKLDIAFFIVAGIAVWPLFKETPLQWLFNCLTAMNVYAVSVVLSYELCDFFPHPYYAMTGLRALIFVCAIALFRRRLRPLYRQAAERFGVYLFVAAGLFANFAWYFIASDDIEKTLSENVVPLLLLVLLTVLVYLSVFLSLRKTLREAALREENLKLSAERERTRARLLLMDEAVRRMNVERHDQRHFGRALLTLLEQGETKKAIGLIRDQSDALLIMPRRYCENLSVNAAVSYYAEMAQKRDIRCEIRLDIPEELSVDELSLAMAVSNLMENAVDAICALPPGKERILRLSAAHAGQLLLEIDNPYGGDVAFDERGLPYSSKPGHGQGVQSVADFVARCGGELIFDAADGVFRARMILS